MAITVNGAIPTIVAIIMLIPIIKANTRVVVGGGGFKTAFRKR